MSKKENGSGVAPTLFSWLTIPIVLGCIGYFVYDRSGDAALAVALYSFICGMMAIVGLLPIIGQVLYVWLGGKASVALLTLFGIEQTTLTQVAFWIAFAQSIIASCIGLAVILSLVTAVVVMRRSKLKWGSEKTPAEEWDTL